MKWPQQLSEYRRSASPAWKWKPRKVEQTLAQSGRLRKSRARNRQTNCKTNSHRRSSILSKAPKVQSEGRSKYQQAQRFSGDTAVPAKRPLSHFATECSGMNSANFGSAKGAALDDRCRRVYPDDPCFRCYRRCKLDTTARIASDFNMASLSLSPRRRAKFELKIDICVVRIGLACIFSIRRARRFSAAATRPRLCRLRRSPFGPYFEVTAIYDTGLAGVASEYARANSAQPPPRAFRSRAESAAATPGATPPSASITTAISITTIRPPSTTARSISRVGHSPPVHATSRPEPTRNRRFVRPQLRLGRHSTGLALRPLANHPAHHRFLR